MAPIPFLVARTAHRLSPRAVIFAAALLLSLALVIVPAVRADTNDQLHRYFDGLKTLQADFTQVLYGQDSQPRETSHGVISVSRPNRFRLEYNKPYHQIYVADGKKLWSYDEDLEQVTVKPQDGMLANTPAMLLSNPRKLDDSFVVAPLGERHGMTWFELTPKRKDTNFERIALAFDRKDLKVMVLQDSLGQTTRLEFSHVEYNRPIPAKTFQFVPPKGVDVIGEQ